MNKKPIWVLTGLAVAAVAVVGGLTKDMWMAGPQRVAAVDIVGTPDQATPAPQPQPEQQVAVEQSAPAPQPEQQAAVEQPAPEPQPEQQAAVEQPTAEPQPEQQAAVEQPTPEAQPEQQAAVEQPAPEAQPEQQAVVEQPAPEPQPEQQAAAEQPTVEPQPEQQAAVEQPAPETQPEQPGMSEQDGKADMQPKPEQIPAFDTVRVEKTGEAVIAGTAKPDAEVVVKLDGNEIGKTVANNDGAFVVIPDNPLPAGSGALTIESKGKGDIAPTASEQAVAVIVPAQASKQEALVAVVSPGAPTRVLQVPDPEPAATEEQQVAVAQPETVAPEPPAAPKSAVKAPRLVSLDAVDYDEAGDIVFSGRGEPGHSARVYVDNGFLGEAAIDGDGRWQFSGTAAITAGVHTLRVDGLDAAGKVMNRVEVPFFREDTRKVASATPQAGTEAEPQQPAAEPQQPAAELQQPAAEPQQAEAVEVAPEPAAEAPAELEVAAADTQDAPVPTESETATEALDAVKDGRVVIQPGNNLWRISKVLYGTGTKFTVIYEANKNQMRDPDRIYPGQIFMTPNVVPPAETIDPKRRDPIDSAADAAQ